MAHKQILSNETQNSHGFVVLNDSIIWDRYRKNPILLRDPRWGGHDGMPVGRVENVRLEGSETSFSEPRNWPKRPKNCTTKASSMPYPSADRAPWQKPKAAKE